MRKLKLYLETSIFNFAFAEDSLSEREATLRLLAELGRYDVYISDVVLGEILETQDEEKRQQLLDLIKQHRPQELHFDEQARILAEKYLQEGVIPRRYQEDAFHIAIASVHNLDVLISWNFSHIVKLKTKREIVGINVLMGYQAMEICSPWEVIENE